MRYLTPREIAVTVLVMACLIANIIALYLTGSWFSMFATVALAVMVPLTTFFLGGTAAWRESRQLMRSRPSPARFPYYVNGSRR